MQQLSFPLFAILFLVACVPTEPNREIPQAAPESVSDIPVKNCELKRPGGGGNCDDGNLATGIESLTETVSASGPRPFNPSDCTARGLDGYAKLAELGNRFKDWKAYCVAVANSTSQGSGAVTGSDASPSVSATSGTGGGCEWKQRNYSSGDSIYYSDPQAPIYSSDLRVFGQDFGSLSGKSGPWQQCQCSSSSGHWGCV